LETALTIRAIQDSLTGYPIPMHGEVDASAPHDLRRTYAQLVYEANVDLFRVQQKRGHADGETTLGYIDPMDAKARRATACHRSQSAPLTQAKSNDRSRNRGTSEQTFSFLEPARTTKQHVAGRNGVKSMARAG